MLTAYFSCSYLKIFENIKHSSDMSCNDWQAFLINTAYNGLIKIKHGWVPFWHIWLILFYPLYWF